MPFWRKPINKAQVQKIGSPPEGFRRWADFWALPDQIRRDYVCVTCGGGLVYGSPGYILHCWALDDGRQMFESGFGGVGGVECHRVGSGLISVVVRRQ